MEQIRDFVHHLLKGCNYKGGGNNNCCSSVRMEGTVVCKTVDKWVVGVLKHPSIFSIITN